MAGVTERLKFNDQGLIPVVTQDATNGEVLMVAWMNREAVERTLVTGRATYWSRSRQKFWVKGESSGNIQWVREMRSDCDGDALLLRVEQEGAACHEGFRSCFSRVAAEGEWRVVAERLTDPY
jgi:phosphoribosyl-AMP cyclohydrolase